MRRLWLRAALVFAAVFVAAAIFSAYLQPAMLVEFANLLLCSPAL